MVLDDFGIFLAELSHGLSLILKSVSILSDKESIKLLFLISMTALLNDDVQGQILQETTLEVVKAITLGSILIDEVAEQGVPLVVSLREGTKCVASLLDSWSDLCKLRIEEFGRFTVGGGTSERFA